MPPPIPHEAGSSGFGWNQELWPDKRFPTAADLDAVVPDRPVVLERVDGHAIVANSAAMKAAGVTARRQAPPAARIDNGAVRRQCPTDLVDKADPAADRGRARRGAGQGAGAIAAVGVTAIGSMSTSIADWKAFRRAGDAGTLQRAADRLC